MSNRKSTVRVRRWREKRLAEGRCIEPGCTALRRQGQRCAECADRNAAATRARYHRTNTPVERFRKKLMAYGVPVEIAGAAAAEFSQPSQRCEICGLEQSRVFRWASKNRHVTLPGGPRQWERLHLDHIDPEGPRNDLANIRLLCARCNNLRREGIKTDEQVRRAAFKFWTRRLGKQECGSWLRTPEVP